MKSEPHTRRRRILNAARAHFERFGFRRAVVNDIVREVGIAKGSFYLEFRSKDELFTELVASLRQEREASLASALSRKTTMAGRLETALRHILESSARFPLLARVAAGDPEFLPHVRRLGLDAPGDGSAQLKALVEEGVATGELRPGLDVATTVSVLGLLRGIAQAGGVDTLPGHSAQFVEGILDLTLHGLLVKGGGLRKRSSVAARKEPARPSESPVSAASAAPPEEPVDPEQPAQPSQIREQRDGWAEW
jgi:TetR/AcrR family transcriptional regulator, cholesterol catabolism regulator